MKRQFDTLITAKKNPFKLNIKETLKYKDLIWLFVERDFKTKYKQTILGPLWFIIQPLLTTFIFTIVFGVIAKMSTDGVPRFLFYLSGNVPWLFFAAVVNQTSATFYSHYRLFGKVYFPRIITPISTVITCFFNFLIQFIMFIIVDVVMILTGANAVITVYALLSPLLILQLGVFVFSDELRCLDRVDYGKIQGPTGTRGVRRATFYVPFARGVFGVRDRESNA